MISHLLLGRSCLPWFSIWGRIIAHFHLRIGYLIVEAGHNAGLLAIHFSSDNSAKGLSPLAVRIIIISNSGRISLHHKLTI